MPITATAGQATATVVPKRPSWADMKKYYPDRSVTTPTLYDTKIGGGFAKLYDQPGYENTCAVRMSYGLNYSGLKLPKAAGTGASIQGKDKFWYWLRVKDLKAELARRFGGADEELALSVIPTTLLDDKAKMTAVFDTRVKEARDFLAIKLDKKKGIVAFDVTGWGDASGHFTLWDGDAKTLAYADGHDDNSNNSYYFWLTQMRDDGGKKRLIQVVKVKFWELK